MLAEIVEDLKRRRLPPRVAGDDPLARAWATTDDPAAMVALLWEGARLQLYELGSVTCEGGARWLFRLRTPDGAYLRMDFTREDGADAVRRLLPAIVPYEGWEAAIEGERARTSDPIALLLADLRRLDAPDPRWLARWTFADAWRATRSSLAMRDVLSLLGRDDLREAADRAIQLGVPPKVEAGSALEPIGEGDPRLEALETWLVETIRRAVPDPGPLPVSLAIQRADRLVQRAPGAIHFLALDGVVPRRSLAKLLGRLPVCDWVRRMIEREALDWTRWSMANDASLASLAAWALEAMEPALEPVSDAIHRCKGDPDQLEALHRRVRWELGIALRGGAADSAGAAGEGGAEAIMATAGAPEGADMDRAVREVATRSLRASELIDDLVSAHARAARGIDGSVLRERRGGSARAAARIVKAAIDRGVISMASVIDRVLAETVQHATDGAAKRAGDPQPRFLESTDEAASGLWPDLLVVIDGGEPEAQARAIAAVDQFMAEPDDPNAASTLEAAFDRARAALAAETRIALLWLAANAEALFMATGGFRLYRARDTRLDVLEVDIASGAPARERRFLQWIGVGEADTFFVTSEGFHRFADEDATAMREDPHRFFSRASLRRLVRALLERADPGRDTAVAALRAVKPSRSWIAQREVPGPRDLADRSARIRAIAEPALAKRRGIYLHSIAPIAGKWPMIEVLIVRDDVDRADDETQAASAVRNAIRKKDPALLAGVVVRGEYIK